MEVQARGSQVDVRVITPAGELSDAEADVVSGFEFADAHSSRVGLDWGTAELRTGITASLTLDNPSPSPMTGKAEWHLDPSLFQVEPPTMAVGLPRGGSTNFGFRLRMLRDSVPLHSLPWLEFNVATGARGLRFHRTVVFVRPMTAPYRQVLSVLDGRLPEWEGIPWLPLGEASAPSAEIRALHSKDTVMLAVAVPSVPAEFSEESGFPDALQLGFARRRSDTDFGGDFLRLGFASASDATAAWNRTPGGRSGDTVAGVRRACRQTGDRSVFEIAMPASLLKVVSTRAERRLVLSLAFPVPEGGPTAPEPAQPGYNTFAYQVRYGGGALVPVHFVELVLQSAAQAK